MSQTNNESKPINVRLQQLEMLLADANISRILIRLSNLEDLLQEANDRIYVLENICQSNGIVLHQAEEQVSSDDDEAEPSSDVDSVDSGVVDSEEEEEGFAEVIASGEPQNGFTEVVAKEPQNGGRGLAGLAAEPPNEFTRNDDFVPVSYYDEEDTCYPVLAAEPQDGGWGLAKLAAEPPEFPWNSQLLENGDLIYGTCSDEYEKYYAERTAAFQAAIDAEQENYDWSAFYQFKGLNNDDDKGEEGEDEEEEDDDDNWQRFYGNEDDEEEDEEHDY